MSLSLEPVSDAPLRRYDTSQTQVDTAVATAKQYPRNLEAFDAGVRTTIRMDRQIAASCNYALKKGGKLIEGPSVRLLEIIATNYGNLAVETHITKETDKEVVAIGMASDLQSNVSAKVEVSRRITDKDGQRYPEDVIQTTKAAAMAIAYRNALNRVVPRAFVEKYRMEAKEFARGSEKEFPERLKAAFAWFLKNHQVPEEKLLAHLGRGSLKECTINDLDVLLGMVTSIKDEGMSIEEVIPNMTEDEVGAGPVHTPASKRASVPRPPPPAAKNDKAQEAIDEIRALAKKDQIDEDSLVGEINNTNAIGREIKSLGELQLKEALTIIAGWKKLTQANE